MIGVEGGGEPTKLSVEVTQFNTGFCTVIPGAHIRAFSEFFGTKVNFIKRNIIQENKLYQSMLIRFN